MIDSAASLEVLAEGDIEIVGRILGSTNHAMLGRVTRVCPPPETPVVVDAIYKPIAGERPLDDFPDETLGRREVAAFEAIDDDAEGPDTLHVRLTAEAARGFVNRAIEVVAAGRLPCPLCGQPLDPQGHICPRRNGHYVN
jgi:hypothetical protein